MQVQSLPVIDSTEVRQQRSAGNRFVIVNPNGAKSYYVTSPLYYTHSMNPGEELLELLPNNKLKSIYSKWKQN